MIESLFSASLVSLAAAFVALGLAHAADRFGNDRWTAVIVGLSVVAIALGVASPVLGVAALIAWGFSFL